jgi:hypothetical protein
MPKEKKVCAYCGKSRFGLVRHFVGFHRLCTRLRKERFLERRAREIANYRKLLNHISHNRTVLRYRHP